MFVCFLLVFDSILYKLHLYISVFINLHENKYLWFTARWHMGSLKVGTNENGSGRTRGVANAQNLFRLVVIDVLLYLNLAAILKTFVSVSAPLQPIE
jgi:hypothetical protein